jgi:site-specific DNA-methyltransferase (cytosine-N4-specific)
VEEAYAQADCPMTNAELYAKVASITGLSEAEINSKAENGKAKAQHSPIKRKIRWFQQTLKSMNIIQKVDGERGVWKLANRRFPRACPVS